MTRALAALAAGVVGTVAGAALIAPGLGVLVASSWLVFWALNREVGE